MNRKTVIAVVGTGYESEPAVSNAKELGGLIAKKGWVLITGGRDAGVMQAANEGAKTAKDQDAKAAKDEGAKTAKDEDATTAKDSLRIGILPNSETKISKLVEVAIITDTGQARNNIIVLSADVVVACGVEGAGTASEVALALKNGKDVILLAANEASQKFFAGIGAGRVHNAASAQEVIQLIVDRGLFRQ